MASQLRRQLVEILSAQALHHLEQPIRLASGAWSSVFIDAKEGLAAWSDLRIASEAVVEAVTGAGHRFSAVGGLTLGADALSVGIAAVCDSRWFVVRKEAKTRGTRRLVEGARIGPGDAVLVVDDVVTTGGSIMRACEAVRATGAEVVATATLVESRRTGNHGVRGTWVWTTSRWRLTNPWASNRCYPFSQSLSNRPMCGRFPGRHRQQTTAQHIPIDDTATDPYKGNRRSRWI